MGLGKCSKEQGGRGKGLCAAWDGLGQGEGCVSRKGQDPGRTYKTRILVAENSANGMVKMRRWEGKGR